MTIARGATVALAALACGLPDPVPLPRIVGASPEGGGVATTTAAEIRFSDPVDPQGLLDGGRLVLVPAASLAEAVAAVESAAGAVALASSVRASAALVDGGRRVVLVPGAPLRAFTAHALVLWSGTRAADGRPVLDPDGRRRTFVVRFETGAPQGPPPVPVVTEVRADAATPEAGGEYVEVANLGEGALDLEGWTLAKRTSSGALSSCTISAPDGEVPPGGVALVVGGAYDGRYALPTSVSLARCGTTALLGGLANDRAPEIRLSNPLGDLASTFGAAGGPICPAAAERIDPAGLDEPANIACTSGSPGALAR